MIVAAGAAIVGVVVRFTPHSALWLDEALTVNISRLPLSQLFTALRHDGSPPLYYLVLHFWMGVFGTSTGAVRVLPALISVATLPVAWRLGRTIGGRNTAFAALVLLATSPFAIRYGSENRMYSLVMFLSMVGGLALVRCLRSPTPRWLLVFGVSGGLLLLTHYWALYLVASTGLLLLWGSVRGTNRIASRLSLAALASGSLLFLPWVPSFLYQAAHTGTPWATSP
ncbi:MAG TPA: glycosyltransferase family 39 protein, partial [Acidimicrobiales bacterium]|nr:glycosyltransferase family 39 protein [Acidimicrobiales bacterium]